MWPTGGSNWPPWWSKNVTSPTGRSNWPPLVQKCYVTEMIWYSYKIFSWTNIRMVLEFVLKWFSFNSLLFAEKIDKLALIKKGGLTLVMAAEHRTKGIIWEALLCRILHLSLSTFLWMLECLQRNYQMRNWYYVLTIYNVILAPRNITPEDAHLNIAIFPW